MTDVFAVLSKRCEARLLIAMCSSKAPVWEGSKSMFPKEVIVVLCISGTDEEQEQAPLQPQSILNTTLKQEVKAISAQRL